VEGVPLGLLAVAEYDEVTFQTEPGDVVILYSDGITDQHNEEREEYGPRLDELVRKFCGLSGQQIVDATFRDFDQFRGSHRVFDDQTMLVLKVKERA
jgi:sigma-B regulation protein RsbU (phosphoserine phosphatase)